MALLVMGAAASSGIAQARADSTPPVIDMHMHALGSTGTAAMVAAMDSLNVRRAAFLGLPPSLTGEVALGRGRFIPSLMFPCEGGRAPTSGQRCFEDGKEFPDTAWLRAAIGRKEVQMLGEITAQYMNVASDDPRLEPYWALAEELDIPVGIHLGIAAPGVSYEASRFPPHKSPNYRASAGDLSRLESVLVRHPRLRVYVMHAAWPFLDDMMYMLYMHPQLYVDVAVLQWAIPRPAYHRYLQSLVDAGFGKRIMFGSDGNARRLREGIQAILDAPFLSAEQKRDILHDNAARFLKLPSG